MEKKRAIKVLITDDDANLRDLLEEAVKDWGFEVRVAKDGEDALERLKAERCDIVITDLKMPGMGGIKLLEKIKEYDKDILVIVITGYATIETAVKAIDAGAYDYITKPFRLDELMVIMKNAGNLLLLAEKNRELNDKLDRAYSEIDSLKDSMPGGGVIKDRE
ncbi:MAG: sigma-54-dependent transcriptional regulator [Thermodesulfobacteriota bacterium]